MEQTVEFDGFIGNFIGILIFDTYLTSLISNGFLGFLAYSCIQCT